ncbi:hypothetical protein [Polyangium sp. y55x31]|uniref:hypothetical protein n=1 Tax=Polyangium sp. y55x31 TaxID=3042688 RepID=UPI002482B409|nr:hypothetical protein [Polyangium sp. y55x31]MDI1482528.1 hypothetical protein [Polyangium sp. y55x31]
MRAITLAAVLGLCAGCADGKQLRAEYAVEAQKSLQESLAHQYKRRSLTPVTAQFIGYGADSGGHEPAYTPEGQPKPEPPYKERFLPNAGGLVQRRPGDRVQFHGSYCLIGSSCGCEQEMKYHFATKPDGSVVVLVPEPQKEVHTITRSGTCSEGCGQPSMSPTSSIWELPTTDIDHVTAIVVPYELHIVRETCSNPLPAP